MADTRHGPVKLRPLQSRILSGGFQLQLAPMPCSKARLALVLAPAYWSNRRQDPAA